MAAILERQAAAAEAKRKREQEAAEAAQKASDRRDATERLWKEQSALLDNALEQLNAAMAENDVKLIRPWSGNDGPAGQIDRAEIRFTTDVSRNGLKCLMIHIGAGGKVFVRMGTDNHMPAKQYSFALEDANEKRWTETLLDFVDVNTPNIDK